MKQSVFRSVTSPLPFNSLSISSETSGSQSQISSSAPTSTSPGALDCQPDNCLRQFSQSPSVTAFCATYTTAVQTGTTGLPTYVSQCSSVPSRISSACSCIVTNILSTTPTTNTTAAATTTTSSTVSSSTQASTISTTSATTTSGPTETSSTSTTTPLVVQNCSPDNCYRQFLVSPEVTAFCETYTTAVQTATTGLPPYVSQCQGIPSRVSSACSCVVKGSSSSPPSYTPTPSSSPTNTETMSSLTSITTTTTTITSLGSAPTTTVLDCQPDNCLRQFSQSPSVTAFCATYTTALQTATTGLPNFVSQCSGVPSHVSSACSCIATGNNTPSTTPSSPPTASEISTTSETSTSLTSSTLTNTPTPPGQNCSPDNCYRQFLASPAISLFCETYTTALQTATIGLPPYVSQCQSIPSRISSACSCVITGNAPPVTGSSTATTSETTTSTSSPGESGTTTSMESSTTSQTPISTTSPVETSTTSQTPTSAVTPPVQNCSPDNCYRQFLQSPAVTPFCETYTTASQTATTGLPPYVSQCQSIPSRISSACSCVITSGSSPSITETTSTTAETTGTTRTTGTTEMTSPNEINTPTSTATLPAQNCSPDNCYRQFLQSPAVTPFCETYTIALQTATTGLPAFVSQCQEIPSRISSACSCVITASSPSRTTGTISNTETTSSVETTSPRETTSSPETSTPTSSPSSPAQNCSPDNCLRQFSQSTAEVTPFCAAYTTALQTASTGLPPFVSQCSNEASRVSSACSCIVPSGSIPTSGSSSSSIPTITSAPTTSPAPPQNCSPDNCLRQFSQSLAEVSTFCVTYTIGVVTATTGLPPFVSQCSSETSRVSSACSCIVSPPASPLSTSGSTPSSSSAPTSPVPSGQNCSPDNCLRQFSQSLADVSTFCATYTTAIETETTGLPPFVSQCSSVVSRVSSACSCIVPPPTLSPYTSGSPLSSTTPMIITATPTPLILDCQPDNCLRQFSKSLAEISTFCATYTTAIEIASTGLPPFISQCSSSPSRVSSACSCIFPPPTSPPISTETSQTTTSKRSHSSATPCVPGYGVDCSSPTGTATSSPTTTSSPNSAPTNTATSTGTYLPTTASSSTSAPTNTGSVPIIFGVQPGNLGYYKKRQTYQSYVGPGGIPTSDCSMAAVYIVYQQQLFIDGQLISTNPGTPHQPFAVSSGGVGTITTTFAIDVNNFLTWQNLNFTNGEAYFCEQVLQINALFDGLYYQSYPPNCEIVSLVAIPGI
jgi:hypothetical protein